MTAGDYNLGQLSEAMNQPKLVGDIIKAWKIHASDRQTVCFTVTVAHSMVIRDAFLAAGVSAEHLDGETPEDERTAILARFRAGFTRIVCNCAVLTEGWDCPEASCLILARPTKSRCLWRQMAGRVLRPLPGKADCLILDHGNCTDTHGFLTDPDQISLHGKSGGERAAPKRACKSCGARFAGRPPFCPQCGISLESEGKRLDEELHPLGDDSFEMVEVSTRKAPPPPAVAERLYLTDLEFAKEHGYAPAWAGIRHKARTGQWPTKEMTKKSRYATKFAMGPDGKWHLVFDKERMMA